MVSPSAWDHLLAAVVGLLLPAAGAMQRRRSSRSDNAPPYEPWQKIAIYWGNSAVLAVLGVAALSVTCASGRTWSDLGLTASPDRLGWGLFLGSLFLLGYAVDSVRQLAPERLPATRARWRQDTPFLPETARELRHSMVLVCAAAIAEEIIYRGFLIGYVAHFTGGTPLGLTAAVAIPALVFGVGHFYQGPRAVLKIVLGAGLFGAVFVITGSLWIPIALHFLVDLIGMLLGPKLLGRELAVVGGEA